MCRGQRCPEQTTVHLTPPCTILTLSISFWPFQGHNPPLGNSFSRTAGSSLAGSSEVTHEAPETQAINTDCNSRRDAATVLSLFHVFGHQLSLEACPCPLTMLRFGEMSPGAGRLDGEEGKYPACNWPGSSRYHVVPLSISKWPETPQQCILNALYGTSPDPDAEKSQWGLQAT